MIWYQHELKSLVPTCLVSYCVITLCEMPSLEYAMPVKNSVISGQAGIVIRLGVPYAMFSTTETTFLILAKTRA